MLSRRVGVVKHDVGAASEPGDVAQRALEGVAREIRRHAEPEERRARLSVEPGRRQRLGERLALEIAGAEAQRGRFDTSLLQPLALLDLRRRMVDLIRDQIGKGRNPAGERVEAGPKRHHLPSACGDRLGARRPRRCGCARR